MFVHTCTTCKTRSARSFLTPLGHTLLGVSHLHLRTIPPNAVPVTVPLHMYRHFCLDAILLFSFSCLVFSIAADQVPPAAHYDGQEPRGRPAVRQGFRTGIRMYWYALFGCRCRLFCLTYILPCKLNMVCNVAVLLLKNMAIILARRGGWQVAGGWQGALKH